MRAFFTLLVLFIFLGFGYGQNPLSERFNKVTPEELAMKTYVKDTTAVAVVLYEHGENYFELINDRVRLVKHYYCKIKILNKKGIKQANITIPFYRNDRSLEKIKNIRAVTHNTSGKRDELAKDQIFTVEVNQHWSEKRFTFPNIKVGSVIEYQYTLETPFVYNFEGWDFQTDIPKVQSVFNAKIPANYRYNRTLKGSQKLNVNEASIKKRCFRIPGIADRADCEVLKYVMNDIPAFKEEAYMLSRNNYISKIVFELSEFVRFNGGKDVYTTTWKASDKKMRKDKNIGAQVHKKKFFKNQLSDAILNEPSELKRAIKIFGFIQNHYTWNKKYGLFGDASVKQAFQKRIGNVAEINLSLVNSLLAAGIKAETVMLSTRAKGLPITSHPILSDFNYIIVKATINNKTYLLDATDKFVSFGIIPIRALNYNGRAMDFKKESYWHTIAPHTNNRQNTSVSITVSEDGSMKGKISEINSGYLAYDKRKELAATDEEAYLDDIENYFDDLQITEYEANSISELEKPTKEMFTIEYEDGLTADITFFDPFIFKIFTENPFKLEDRTYPVDFAYPRLYNFRFLMTLPDNYEFQDLPENQKFNVAGNKAVCILKTVQKNNQLNITFRLVMNDFHFTAEDYKEIKSFFNNLVTIQKNTRLTIKKKNS